MEAVLIGNIATFQSQGSLNYAWITAFLLMRTFGIGYQKPEKGLC